MTAKPSSKARVEISSDQLRAELVEIKERVGALEIVASITNRQQLEEYVRQRLEVEKVRQIMKECEEPRTRQYLVTTLGFASVQALDHHLNHMREDLIHVHHDENGRQTFQWSPLAKRLRRRVLKDMLDGTA